MVNVDDAFEVKYKFAGENFEVLVDFDKLQEFKKNSDNISVYDVLADTKIFKDQKKGEVASENFLSEKFKDKSVEEILKIILIKGECQIPTAYLNKLRGEKKLQVVNYIAENAVNPQTKSKYTSTMISSQIDRLKYNFDPNRDFINQAEEVLKDLKKVMPISMEKMIISLSIPGEFCGAFYGPFRKYGKIIKEYYDDLGNLKIHIEIMESMQDTVLNYISKNSNNQGEYQVLKD